jgi:hypothetical protein
MFNTISDPWYAYMQPFRIVFLKKMIKAQQDSQAKQEASQVKQEASQAKQEASQVKPVSQEKQDS